MSEYIDSLQRIAMLHVESPTYEDWLRRIRRWFSKEYHTPLREVEDFDDEYVIVTYYESIFETMDPEERKNRIFELIETEEEKKARIQSEEDFDKKWLQEMKEEADEIAKEKAAGTFDPKKRITSKKALKGPIKQAEAKPAPIKQPETPPEPIVFEFNENE